MIGKTDTSWSGYADDIGMHLASIKDLQTASRILDQVFGQYQLIINYKKTETMILNYLNIKDVYGPKRVHIFLVNFGVPDLPFRSREDQGYWPNQQ